MKTETEGRIPIPLSQRLRELRLRLIPVLVFAGALFAIGQLWRDFVAAPSMVGQAEPVLAHVSSYKPGVLAELSVARFQKVKAGDVVGQVLVADPKVLESSLAVIRSEIEVLRYNLRPLATQQRAAIDYDQMRLDWMRDRAQLASVKVNTQLAETEFRRMQELFKDKIISQRQFEQAEAKWSQLKAEQEELMRVVAEGERNLQELQVTNVVDLKNFTADPILAGIAVEEAKLKLTEAELSPVVLKAPMDGIVTMVLLRSGESVTAGQPIVSIATLHPVRIVGYMRPPILTEPQVGMEVEVRTRGLPRGIGTAKIVQVGTQMEPLPPTMLGPIRLTGSEVGLAVDISLPPNLPIRPGELVDVVFLARAGSTAH